MRIPPPRLSPRPPGDQGPEEPSGVRIRREFHLDDLRVYAASIVTAVAICFSVFFALDSRSQTRSDAGAVTAHNELVEYKKYNDSQVQDLKESSRRQDLKLDAMLFRFGVPNPAPAPKDAGP